MNLTKNHPVRLVTTPAPNINLTKNHPVDQIIGSKDKGVIIRNKVHKEKFFISQVELKSEDGPCNGDHWIQAMKEELDQIVKNETWELVPRP